MFFSNRLYLGDDVHKSQGTPCHQLSESFHEAIFGRGIATSQS